MHCQFYGVLVKLNYRVSGLDDGKNSRNSVVLTEMHSAWHTALLTVSSWYMLHVTYVCGFTGHAIHVSTLNKEINMQEIPYNTMALCIDTITVRDA
jgi:hypothetical protein